MKCGRLLSVLAMTAAMTSVAAAFGAAAWAGQITYLNYESGSVSQGANNAAVAGKAVSVHYLSGAEGGTEAQAGVKIINTAQGDIAIDSIAGGGLSISPSSGKIEKSGDLTILIKAPISSLTDEIPVKIKSGGDEDIITIKPVPVTPKASPEALSFVMGRTEAKSVDIRSGALRLGFGADTEVRYNSEADDLLKNGTFWKDAKISLVKNGEHGIGFEVEVKNTTPASPSCTFRVVTGSLSVADAQGGFLAAVAGLTLPKEVASFTAEVSDQSMTLDPASRTFYAGTPVSPGDAGVKVGGVVGASSLMFRVPSTSASDAASADLGKGLIISSDAEPKVVFSGTPKSGDAATVKVIAFDRSGDILGSKDMTVTIEPQQYYRMVVTPSLINLDVGIEAQASKFADVKFFHNAEDVTATIPISALSLEPVSGTGTTGAAGSLVWNNLTIFADKTNRKIVFSGWPAEPAVKEFVLRASFESIGALTANFTVNTTGSAVNLTSISLPAEGVVFPANAAAPAASELEINANGSGYFDFEANGYELLINGQRQIQWRGLSIGTRQNREQRYNVLEISGVMDTAASEKFTLTAQKGDISHAVSFTVSGERANESGSAFNLTFDGGARILDSFGSESGGMNVGAWNTLIFPYAGNVADVTISFTDPLGRVGSLWASNTSLETEVKRGFVRASGAASGKGFFVVSPASSEVRADFLPTSDGSYNFDLYYRQGGVLYHQSASSGIWRSGGGGGGCDSGPAGLIGLPLLALAAVISVLHRREN
jgi:hypothetical protein